MKSLWISIIAVAASARATTEDQELFAWFDKFGYTPYFTRPVVMCDGFAGMVVLNGPISHRPSFIIKETSNEIDTLSFDLTRYRWIADPQQTSAREDKFGNIYFKAHFLEQIHQEIDWFRDIRYRPDDLYAYNGVFQYFVLARICAARSRPIESAQFMRRVRQIADICHLDIQLSVESGLADVEFDNLHRSFSDPTKSLRDLASKYDGYLERFPRTTHRDEALADKKGLQENAYFEEWARNSGGKNLDSVPGFDRVRELIWRLRLTTGTEETIFFPSPTEDEPKSAAVQLVELGFFAVPNIIAALQDENLTRVTRDGRTCYVLRVSDIALKILYQIAGPDHYDEFRPGLNVRPMVAEPQINEWWEGVIRQGGPDFLVQMVKDHPKGWDWALWRLANVNPPKAFEAFEYAYRFAGTFAEKEALLHPMHVGASPRMGAFLKDMMRTAGTLRERMIGAREYFRYEPAASVAMAEGQWLAYSPARDEDGSVAIEIVNLLIQTADGFDFVRDHYNGAPAELRSALVCTLVVFGGAPSLNEATRSLLRVVAEDTTYSIHTPQGYVRTSYGDPIFVSYSEEYGRDRLCDMAVCALTGKSAPSFETAERHRLALLGLLPSVARGGGDPNRVGDIAMAYVDGDLAAQARALRGDTISTEAVIELLRRLWVSPNLNGHLGILTLLREEGSNRIRVGLDLSAAPDYDGDCVSYSVGADRWTYGQLTTYQGLPHAVDGLREAISKALSVAAGKSISISVQVTRRPASR